MKTLDFILDVNMIEKLIYTSFVQDTIALAQANSSQEIL
jgi:hypothetical protein